MFCYAVLNVLSSFAITSQRKRELVALLYLSSCCHMAVIVLSLFLMALWVDLQGMIVAFPGQFYFFIYSCGHLG